jgi:hypothetical protein
MNLLTLLLGQWQRLALYGALVAVVCGFVYFKGYQHGRDQLDQYVAAQALEATRIVTRQGKVTEKILTRYVEVAGATHTVTETVEKEVIRYADANPAGLCLDADWRRLHDSAAANTFPGAPGAPPGGLRAPAEPTPGPTFPWRRPGPPDRHGELREASSLR